MKTPKGIYVDLIDAANGQKPLEFVTEDAVFVRMPHGNFRVRVVTPQLTDVTVHMDDVELLHTQVPQTAPGNPTLLSAGSDGKPFSFRSPDSEPEARPAKDEPAQQTLFEMAVATPPKHSHGLVVVSVKFAEQAPTATSPGTKGDRAHHVIFQMNAPKDHERALADNLHKVVPPEAIERRRCSCCS